MAERAIPLTQPTRTDRPNRRVSFPEAITALAIVAALLTVGARVTGRLPNERAAAIADQPTRLIQMGGVWAQPATNPQRDRIFHILDPATGTETARHSPSICRKTRSRSPSPATAAPSPTPSIPRRTLFSSSMLQLARCGAR
jgi:hypothetical protein